MTTAHANPLTLEPLAARSYLLSMAEVLSKSVAPAVQGDTANRVAECVSLMLRMAAEISPSDKVTTALQLLNASLEAGGASSPIDIARLEAVVLAEADADLQAAAERIAETSSAARHFDSAGFESYLRAHQRGGPGVQVIRARVLSGGRSKLTTLVQQQGAADLPADLIVRQDWAGGGVQGTTVVSEYALIKGVFEAGLKVPEPLLIEPSKMLGAPFLIVSRMAGRQQGSYFYPPQSEGLALDVAEQLAMLHRLPTAPFIEAGVPNGARTPEQMTAALDGFRAVHSRFGVKARSIDLALDWLEHQSMRIDTSLWVLVHNDIGVHNLMMEGDALTAILDWELAAIDHPAIDLGYAREWISGILPWSRFMDRYRAVGGSSIDALTQDYYTLWSAVRVYVLLVNARVAITRGSIREMEVVHTAADALPRLVRRISRELCAATQRHPE